MGSVRDFLNAFNNSSVMLLVRSRTQPGKVTEVSDDEPLPVRVVSSSTVSDPASAREVTLAQVRDGIQALSALLGNTDGLEALLTTQATYLDQVESLLSTLGSNTDGIEGLLAALGIKDDNVLAKLEALRVLLAATLTVQGTVQVGGPLPLPTGAATQATLEAVRTLLAGTLTVSTGNNDPATGARQTTTNTALATLLTENTFKARMPVPGQGTKAASVPVVLASDTDVLKTTPDSAAFLPTTVALKWSTAGTVSDVLNLSGATVLRLAALTAAQAGAGGVAWATADITFEVSGDGTIWQPLIDYNSASAIKISGVVAGGGARSVPLGDMFRLRQIRVTSSAAQSAGAQLHFAVGWV